MALKAVEYLDDINDVSTRLLKLLDTSALVPEQTKEVQANQALTFADNTKKLLTLMAVREEKIYQLFDQFSYDELQNYQEQLQTMGTLDNLLIDTVNQSQKSAKSNIIKLKKNRKAIDIYQKL